MHPEKASDIAGWLASKKHGSHGKPIPAADAEASASFFESVYLEVNRLVLCANASVAGFHFYLQAFGKVHFTHLV
jgi:hypothetical protein